MNILLGSLIIVLIIVAIAMGVVNDRKNQTTTSAKISARIISAPVKDIIIYPNPFKPSKGHSVITFANLTEQTKVRIFNIMGEQVYKIDNVKGNFEWFVTNDFGEKLASGIYFCIIENRNEKKKVKKIAVIR